MYHGEVVPGFPQHPHRGFETVTIVRRGLHRSLRLAGRGRALRRRRRAVADRGQRHRALRDVPAARRASAPNPLELFQIWLNLPGRRQDGRAALLDAVEPDRSRGRSSRDADGRTTEVDGGGRRSCGDARAAAAAAAARGRRARTATSPSGRSSWRRARAGRCRAAAAGTQPHALLLPRRRRCASAAAPSPPYHGVELRPERRGRAGERAPTRRELLLLQGARSASRSPSTARS